MNHPPASEAFAYRIGAASVGLFAGMALGFMVGILALHMAPFVFGGAAAGAITGLIFPEVGLRSAEITFHFFAGLFGGARALAADDFEDLDMPQASQDHRWLKAAFTFGVVFTMVLAVLLRM